ncbi:MAG: WYL domain-containing protein [Candidatus Dehalobacter alkaniphilus]
MIKDAILSRQINAWYLQAFCLTRSTYRTFKIARMSDVLMTPKSFSERISTIFELTTKDIST